MRPVEVCRSQALPGYHVHIDSTVFDAWAPESGRALEEARRDLAMGLARAVVNRDDVIRMEVSHPYVKLKADAVVMSADDLRRFAEETFQRGVEAGRYAPRGFTSLDMGEAEARGVAKERARIAALLGSMRPYMMVHEDDPDHAMDEAAIKGALTVKVTR